MDNESFLTIPAKGSGDFHELGQRGPTPTTKYLRVNLLVCRFLRFDITPTKCAFYSACNSIFMCGTAADELVLLTLQESYSLPVLIYAIPALSLKLRQADKLLVYWNNVFRSIPNYNKQESVKAAILGLFCLNLKHLITHIHVVL